MKSILTSGTLATLLLACSTVNAATCTYILPAKSNNPWSATALLGYYLQAGSDGSAKLVYGQSPVAVRESSNGPLGLWITPPAGVDACPGYKFLNAANGTVGFEALSWGSPSTTNWNATAGSDLTTVVNGVTISKFIACKLIGSTDSSYNIYLQTGSASTITPPPNATAPAVNGTYLGAINEIGVLIPGPNDAAFTYGSSGGLGLWGAGPTANGCPGYAFLNAAAKSSAYSVLTWDSTSTTSWNATAGGYLTKLGATPSSDFLACKRKSSANSAYVLLLRTASVIPASIENGPVKLTAGQSLVAARDGPNAPLALWLPATTISGCPGYKYLNAANGTVGYENLYVKRFELLYLEI
ncbi:hypothetical protein FRB90_007572 [Tulasnella sp. 427]|nr:hypothetical protein FRB90_007572 [Tulasnella sp. 427]